MTIPQAFAVAVQHHQSGRLPDAEAIYRQILAVEPRHAEALHLLGVIAHQVGRHEVAVALIRQAITLNPKYPDAHNDLGNALKGEGQPDKAIAAYRNAITVKPNFPEAHNNLGTALHDRGHVDEAIAAYHQAITLRPDYAEAHYNLGNALFGNGQFDQAITAYRQAITLKPNFPEAYYNLGIALTKCGRLDEAVAAYRHAIAFKPDFAMAHCNLGVALKDRGQLDDAIAAYRRAIALKPDYAIAYCHLGVPLQDEGQLDEAVAAYRRAIALKPDYAMAHCNLGGVLRDQGQLVEAIAASRRALALNPDLPQAYSNLGNALNDNGQVDEAIAAHRQAIVVKPDVPEAHSNLLLTLNYHPSLDARAIDAEHRCWNRKHGEPLRAFVQPHLNDRTPDRRLRIGYVSPDLRLHPVAFFLESLLAKHDHAQIEIFCYADVPKPDAVSNRMEQHSGNWRNITSVKDAQVGDLIRQDGIDILVDLAGHTGGNRLTLFARRPAPVQVTWLGYPNTTGLDTIDYRLTDAIAAPPGTAEHLHTEQLVRLPATFACFRPAEDSPAVGPLPALACGHVTFGSFHTLAKLNDRLLASWAKLLMEVPKARLMMVAAGLDEQSCRQRFIEFFGRRGVVSERLEFKARQPLAQYLTLHQEVDVLLDSHPFSGHTVSCHALWMGVPVVTLAGPVHCSRMVTSVLTNVGLSTLVAESAEDYVRLAKGMASDLPRLAHLRSTLRQRMEESPLMDAAHFARDIEAAYREMWRRWCMTRG